MSAPIFRTLESAVEATTPDVVVNLTPPEWHRPVVETALGLGCHVFGEKPIATTLEDAQALVRAAERAGRTYAVMQNRRFEHGIRTLRDGLAAGRIGSVTTLACDFFKAPHFGGFREAMESPLLLDMAIHQFDQARFVVGVDPVAVSCHEFNPAGSWYQGRAAAICTFELADGSVFSYRGSWSAEGFGTSWNGSWRVSRDRRDRAVGRGGRPGRGDCAQPRRSRSSCTRSRTRSGNGPGTAPPATPAASTRCSRPSRRDAGPRRTPPTT